MQNLEGVTGKDVFRFSTNPGQTQSLVGGNPMDPAVNDMPDPEKVMKAAEGIVNLVSRMGEYSDVGGRHPGVNEPWVNVLGQRLRFRTAKVLKESGEIFIMCNLSPPSERIQPDQ